MAEGPSQAALSTAQPGEISLKWQNLALSAVTSWSKRQQEPETREQLRPSAPLRRFVSLNSPGIYLRNESPPSSALYKCWGCPPMRWVPRIILHPVHPASLLMGQAQADKRSLFPLPCAAAQGTMTGAPSSTSHCYFCVFTPSRFQGINCFQENSLCSAVKTFLSSLSLHVVGWRELGCSLIRGILRCLSGPAAVKESLISAGSLMLFFGLWTRRVSQCRMSPPVA